MDKQDLTLRFATRDDVDLVLRFIRELADYEELLHEVVATHEDVERTLFCERPRAEVLIAEWADKPAGFALFFHNYSTFLSRPGLYLEDLYVRPEFRGKGIGKKLLVELARIATERGCGRMEWWVLDWNESSIGFYKSLGARPMNQFTVYRLSGDALGDLAAQHPGSPARGT
jgi:GNAT superfamily N-acetyltransferase